MTIKEFIEAAIEGGFDLPGGADLYTKDEEYFLNPAAWKAVGKVKGWPQGYEIEFAGNMIRALWSGKTLEEYIATL